MATVEPSEVKVSDRMIEEVSKKEVQLLEKIREFAGTTIEVDLARQAQMRNPPISPEEFMQVATKHRALDKLIRDLLDDLVQAHVETLNQLALEYAGDRTVE